ncbi:small membrane protein YoaI, partial [Salmonella enterica subsp. enterica serovar Infantis]
ASFFANFIIIVLSVFLLEGGGD